MNPLIWLFVFIFNGIGAWVNKLNNDGPGFFWWACLVSMIPVFPIISRYSKSLLIDGLIYDVVIFFSYLIVLLALGCGKAITLIQWVGFALTLIGVILMKVKI
jgi:hypothetical protein